MSRDVWRRRGLCLLLVGALLAAGARSVRADDALSPAEVACDAWRLSGLLARARATSGDGRTTTLALSFTSSGDVFGLVASSSAPGAAETMLSFSSNPEETTLLRNPARPQLFAVGVTRNDLASDLVAAGAPGAIRVSIDPTTEAEPPPGDLLAIDNLSQPSGRIADAKPGRGLAPLLAPCHPAFSTSDVHVFRVLARVARVEVAGAAAVEIAIRRAAAGGSYRLDAEALDAVGQTLGRLAAGIHLDGAPGRALGTGRLEILPRCTPEQVLDCTTLGAAGALALIRPVAAGPPPSTPYRVATSGPLAVEVDFADLLRGTSWRSPR